MRRDSSLDQFFYVAHSIDGELSDSIVESLSRLGASFESRQNSLNEKVKILKQIDTYLKKKADESDPVISEFHGASLRKLRNELAHGKIQRGKDFSAFYSTLWKAITRLGMRMPSSQLEDLLAYSMGVVNLNMARRGATATKVISVYKPIFNSLELEEKRHAFANLLLRLFYDSESMALLDAGGKT